MKIIIPTLSLANRDQKMSGALLRLGGISGPVHPIFERV